MNDDVDTIVSFGLKNWAARHQPPRDGRALLLEKAATSGIWQERSAFMSFVRGFFVPQMPYRSVEDGVLVSFSPMRTWNFHIAHIFRMAA
jgi:hypothetical protein